MTREYPKGNSDQLVPPDQCPICRYHHALNVPCVDAIEAAERGHPAPPNTVANAHVAIAKTEFSVREVTRFIVNRYDASTDGNTGQVVTKGEFDNRDVANEVAYALACEETLRLGLSPDDARVQYPKKYEGHPAIPKELPGVLGNAYTDLFMLDTIQKMYRDRELRADEVMAANRLVIKLREIKRSQNKTLIEIAGHDGDKD